MYPGVAARAGGRGPPTGQDLAEIVRIALGRAHTLLVSPNRNFLLIDPELWETRLARRALVFIAMRDIGSATEEPLDFNESLC